MYTHMSPDGSQSGYSNLRFARDRNRDLPVRTSPTQPKMKIPTNAAISMGMGFLGVLFEPTHRYTNSI
ncbi:hypothetical protein D3C87_2140830 [compost metagenome]